MFLFPFSSIIILILPIKKKSSCVGFSVSSTGKVSDD